MKNTTKYKAQREVMQNAWKMVRDLGIKLGEALKKAWKAFRSSKLVQKAIRLEYFKIEFVKKDGTITERVGSNAKVKGQNLMFFSVSNNGFRMANIDKILKISKAEVKISIQ